MSTATLNLITCNGCGAPVDPPQGSTFTTCSRCGSRLEHNTSDGATRLAQAPEKKQEPGGRELHALRVMQQLQALDQEWQVRHASALIRDRHGNTSIPSAGPAYIQMIIGSLIGLVWMELTQARPVMHFSGPMDFPSGMGSSFPSTNLPALLPLLGWVIIGFSIVSGLGTLSRARSYQAAEAHYRRRREELSSQL